MIWTSLLVEIIAAASFLAVGWAAWSHGAREVSTLLSATAFGLAVEVLFVTLFDGYEYGRFLLRLPVGGGETVPIWVALGWGTIIWTAMQAGSRAGFTWWVRPAMDALLAVSLDIALDPIAEALGWWHWLRPGQFFGIPCDNFIGWVLIVWSYSFAVQAAFQIWPANVVRWRDSLLPVAALAPAVLFVGGSQFPLAPLYKMIGEPLTFFALCAGLLTLVFVTSKDANASEDPPWYLTTIPVLYHGLMLFFLLSSGSQFPELLIVLPLAALVSLFGFRFPRRSHVN